MSRDSASPVCGILELKIPKIFKLIFSVLSPSPHSSSSVICMECPLFRTLALKALYVQLIRVNLSMLCFPITHNTYKYKYNFCQSENFLPTVWFPTFWFNSWNNCINLALTQFCTLETLNLSTCADSITDNNENCWKWVKPVKMGAIGRNWWNG